MVSKFLIIICLPNKVKIYFQVYQEINALQIKNIFGKSEFKNLIKHIISMELGLLLKDLTPERED